MSDRDNSPFDQIMDFVGAVVVGVEKIAEAVEKLAGDPSEADRLEIIKRMAVVRQQIEKTMPKTKP